MTQLSTSIKIPALPPFVAAIDPGKQTGLCVLRRQDDRVVHYSTYDFFSVQDALTKIFADRSKCRVIVEVPPAMLFENQERAQRADARKVRDRMMTAIGGVRREAQLLAEACRRLGFLVIEVVPVREKKWTDEEFDLFMRGQHKPKQANQHEKDAIRLAVYYKTHRPQLKR